MLSLLSQTSYQSILKSFQELFHRKDVRPGSVTSIQTFGSFAANFNPHCHNMVTEGVFTPQGEFVPLPTPATYILPDIEERFRKLLLKRLHRAERLSETFMNKLLEWNPSGFSVHAEDRGQHLTRYYAIGVNVGDLRLKQPSDVLFRGKGSKDQSLFVTSANLVHTCYLH